MKLRRTMLGISIITLGTLALSSCTPSSAPSADTVRVTMDTPATFDPRQALSLPDFQLARLAFDTLVRRDDSGIVPGLAASWTGDASGLTFTIREDATCSDGSAITPQVVVDSLQSFVDNADANSVAEAFGGTIPQITADEAAGTVTIALEQPWAELLSGLTIASTGIICAPGLTDTDALNAGRVEGAESGPYVLESFEPGVRYVFSLRDDYTAWPEWTTQLDGEAPKTIEYVVAPDASATANLVLSGDLDLARIMPDSRTRFDSVPGVTLASFPFGTFYLVFNERPGNVFADEAARVAVAEAIDRAGFHQTTTDGTGELALTLASSATPCVGSAPSAAIIEQDVDAASAVLSGLPIRLLGAQIVGSAGSGNVFLEESLRAAGADVTLDNVDIGTWAGRTFGEPNTWDLTIFPDLNFLGSYASALQKFTGPEIAEGGPNIGGAQDPRMDELFAQARATGDETERCELYNAAADSLFTGAHTVPLIIEPYIYAQRDGFEVYMLGGSLDDHQFRIVR